MYKQLPVLAAPRFLRLVQRRVLAWIYVLVLAILEQTEGILPWRRPGGRRRLGLVLALVRLSLARPSSRFARRRCPATGHWNQRVDRLPVAAGSDAIVARSARAGTLHADFGSGLWDGGPIGIPITVVGRKAALAVTFEYADGATAGRTRSRATSQIEGGRDADGDRHALIVDRDALPALRALRARPRRRRRLARRLGRDLGPPLEPAAPRGLDVRRRGRAADPPRPRALRRGRRGRIDHALRFTVARPGAPTSSRRATSRAT